MPSKKSIERPTAKSIAAYVKKNAAAVRKAQQAMHMSDSVREADYKGHHIVIRTTYDIRVNGVALEGHLGVGNDGNVHYHPVPNASFSSAIDLVKAVIDVFPDDFTGSQPSPGGMGEAPAPGGMDDDMSGHMHVPKARGARRTKRAVKRRAGARAGRRRQRR